MQRPTQFHPDIPASQPVSEMMLASWQRSEAAGVDRAAGLPRRISDAELSSRQLQATAVLNAAEPHARWLSAALGDVPHVVCVTDADGVVIHATGDTGLIGRLQLSTGCDWSEDSIGTNAAGTAIATGMSVAVSAEQHYVHTLHAIASAAAPIRDPQGKVVASIGLITAMANAAAVPLLLPSYAAFNVERSLLDAARFDQSSRLQGLAGELANQQQRLQEVNERLQLILDNAPVLIYLVDADGRMLGVNRAWQDLLGPEPTALVGHSLSELFPPQVAEEFDENNRRVLRSGEAMQFEESYNGRTYLYVKVPVRDARGQAHAICGMSVDITERKLAEHMLAQSEERFREMADGLPLIIWVHDQTGAQEFVNLTFCEFFGVTREEMKGGKWRLLMHPDDEAGYAASFEESVRRKVPFHAECRVRRADGQWRWIESWGRPRLGGDGVFRGFVGTSADITERKETAARLAASEAALRETDRRKDEFLAALGHELRNPLAPIRNAAEILRRSGPSDPNVLAACGLIERQTSQLVRLVDDLLDVSRVTLGKVTLQEEVLDLRTVLDDAIQATRQEVDRKSHRLTQLVPDEPVWVRGDRVRLSQVVANLLHNAARYTDPGGSICVSVTEEREFAQLVVEDNGKGIAPAELGRIFDLFHQVRAGEEKTSGGLGIGLTLVKRFVEMHGGVVYAESRGPGQGSRFVVRLNSSRPPTAVQPVAAGEQSALRLKVLVIDDNADVLESQARVLTMLGHRVATASGGREGLIVAENFAPDVVLLDLAMPDMDGYSVARALRRSPLGAQAILIAQTGFGHPGLERDVVAAGFDGQVRKGEELQATLSLIERLRQEKARARG